MHDTAKSYQCRHIRTNGRRCGTPSLRGEHLCYQHHAAHRPEARRDAEAIAVGYPIQQPVLHFDSFEDRPSVQLCLLEVMNRIANNSLDLKRGGILLYGLQIASNNLPPEPRAARTQPATRNQQPATVSPEPGCVAEHPVEEITLDPDYGPLAPIAEMPEPDPERDPDQPSPTVVRLLQMLNMEKECYTREEAARPPCTHCGRPGPPKPEPIPTIQAVAA
jgi:hypothetical protein